MARVRYMMTGGNAGISWRAVSEPDCDGSMPLEGDGLYDGSAVLIAVRRDRRRAVDALRTMAHFALDSGRIEAADAYFSAAEAVNEQA